MRGLFESLPIAVKLILRDPINLFLSVVPALIALGIYFLSVLAIWKNSDQLVALFQGFVYTAEQAPLLAKILSALLSIFIFFLMSWTFIILVSIIAAPFNSMLSSRIERQLVGTFVLENRNDTLRQISGSIGQTFKNEFKKIFFILVMTGVALVFQIFPLFYPVGLVILAALFAVQFVDYTWSRHNLHFGSCLKDVLTNIFPYVTSGFFFLFLIAIPLVNAVVPALATSYYTVLWLHRQNKIPSTP